MHTSTVRDRVLAAFAAIDMTVTIDDQTIRCAVSGLIETMPRNTAADCEVSALAISFKRRCRNRLEFIEQARQTLTDLAEQAAGRMADDLHMAVRVAPNSGRMTVVAASPRNPGRELVLAETDRRLAFEEDGMIRPEIAFALRRQIAAQVRNI